MDAGALRRVASYAVLLLLFFAEVTFFDGMRLFGARPELLLAATVFFGFHFGIMRGLETGIVSGLIKAAFSVAPSGISLFSFALAGSVSGAFKNKLSGENPFIEFLLAGACVGILSSVNFIYFTQALGMDSAFTFWRLSFYKALYTGITAPVLFFMLGKIFGRKSEQLS